MVASRGHAHVTDAVLGAVWTLGGVLLGVAGLLGLLPSVYALAGLALVVGLLGLAAGFVTRSNPGFWAEVVPGALQVTFAVLAVRFPVQPATLALLAAGVFLADGVVRLAAAREFPGLRPGLLVAGLLSVGMGVLVLAEVIAPTIGGVALLLGCQLVIDGVVAWRVARPAPVGRRR